MASGTYKTLEVTIMIIIHNDLENTFLVSSNGETILEILKNVKRGCLEVTHYGHHETAIRTEFNKHFNLEVGIERTEGKAFDTVVIRSDCAVVSWEHCE